MNLEESGTYCVWRTGSGGEWPWGYSEPFSKQKDQYDVRERLS